jgi:hypothetical protein
MGLFLEGVQRISDASNLILCAHHPVAQETLRTEGAKRERERVLDEISKRADSESEYAEMPCQDGWHTGDHPTNVIRISYLESIIESLHQSEGVEQVMVSSGRFVERHSQEKKKNNPRPVCPECGSNENVIKNGTVERKGVKVQNWHCKTCKKTW